MSHKNTKITPSSLEEAFDLVNKRPKSCTSNTSNTSAKKDPFAAFLVNMTECLKKDNVQLSEQKELTVNNPKSILLVEDKSLKTDHFETFVSSMVQCLNKEKSLLAEAEILKIDTNKEEQETIETALQKKIEASLNSQVKEYVDELGPNKVIVDKLNSKEADIRKLIAEQVSTELNKFKQQINFSNESCGGGAGGGGTNAVQYAAGGVMNGDLNVTGRILSGGVDLMALLSNIGGGGGGGPTDRLVAGSQVLQLNTDGTLTFPNNIIESSVGIVATEGLSSLGPMLSGTQNLTEIFLTEPVHLDAGLF